MSDQIVSEYNMQSNNGKEEISLKELFAKLNVVFSYLKSKWVLIVLAFIIGGGIGIIYATLQKPTYTATLSFVLEDEKAGGGGMGGAIGLASQLGLDLGSSGGGIFNGPNLIELMKSRTIIQKALLNPFSSAIGQVSFAQYLLDADKFEVVGNSDKIKNAVLFKPGDDRSLYSRQQDSVLQKIFESIVNGMMTISVEDKKASVINIKVKSYDELFSKAFTENVAQVVSDFYIETKSKKAQNNVNILEKKVDSVRNELNNSLTGVAASLDNTYNLNPAYAVKKVPASKRQVDVQANTVILTQLVTNLEMAKMNLLKETPLIQIIDKPILPLFKEKLGRLKSGLFGALISFFTICVYLITGGVIKKRF